MVLIYLVQFGMSLGKVTDYLVFLVFLRVISFQQITFQKQFQLWKLIKKEQQKSDK